MRPRCHRKWRPVFCQEFEFFQFLWKEKKRGHPCSHHSSRSFSRWKVMVPKVTPYDVDLDPFASCPDIQSVCEINVPNDIQPLNTLKLCKNVRQEDAVAVVWKVFDVLGERISTTEAPSRIFTSASDGPPARKSAAMYAEVSLLISCSSMGKTLKWRHHR